MKIVFISYINAEYRCIFKYVLDYLQRSSLTKMYIALEHVKICNFLGILPQEDLGFASVIILTIVTCKINIFSLFHTFYTVKIGEEN